MWLTGWSLFAFGGVYTWTAVPIVAGAAVLAAIVRPRIGGAEFRWLDTALLAALVIAAAQLIPLPPAMRYALSPGLRAAEARLHLDAAQWSASPRPLTLDPAATGWTLAIAAAVILIFWSARVMLEAGGVRRLARAVAIFGLIAAVLSVVQHALAPRLFYGIWLPVASNASPYTPFGNRNHLASWLVMAIPLTLGYAMARLESLRAPAITADLFDDKAVWLTGSMVAMTAALLASLSRSGVIAGAAAALAFVTVARARLARRGQAWLIVALAAVVFVAAAYANLNALWSRLNDVVNVAGVGGRREIWLVTMTIVRDFWTVGVGAGGFERAMSIYQPPHVFSFNTAHDEYLQIVTEGGVALAAAAAVVVGAGAVRIRRGLADDRSAMFWVRAGAVSALIAIAVQSIWETGLHLPANAVLFAVCAAIAMSRPGSK